ncbi:hypothetical protein SAMD00019534_085890, partial [Acytostelium subglobosum LB1]|uniref:hypothetical protein n=1 Tax=Acytostelium subglobosum LB1 TaxID=1410327 RepID=UPI0006447EFD
MYYPMFLWKLYKFIVHLITGIGEIERYCHTYDISGQQRREMIELSIMNSSKLDRVRTALKGEFDAEQVALMIVEDKQINQELIAFESTILPNLVAALEPLSQLQTLKVQIALLRDEAYTHDKLAHEAKLDELWESLKPDVRRTARHTSEWGEIGFQGKDPATDFRGMGILGLDNLLYFATHHIDAAQATLLDANTRCKYPFAITGINLTSVLVNLLMNEQCHLKQHFLYSGPTVQQFHELYVKAFIQFNTFYQAKKPVNIMQFGPIMKEFVEQLTAKVKRPIDPSTKKYSLE